ncbi:MAG: DUF1080 domain-containing protein [Agriterribacter sp.]
MKHFILIFCIVTAATMQYRYQKNNHSFGDNPLWNWQTPNDNTNQKEKWETLFDGKDVSKWRKLTSDSMPSEGWVIKDNTLSVEKGRKGGDIITRELYSSFELEFEFNLTKEANSGIKYLVTAMENSQTKKSSMMGIEYQIIDDYNHPEIKDDPNGLSSTGSAYLLYAPVGKKLLAAGQWNKGRIIVRGKYAEHWLNGVKITSYTRGTPEFNQKLSVTKFKDYPDYAKADTGHIMLTDHGDQVYYRNIKVRKL